MDRYKMAFHKMLSEQDEGKWKGKVSVVDQFPPFLFPFIVNSGRQDIKFYNKLIYYILYST